MSDWQEGESLQEKTDSREDPASDKASQESLYGREKQSQDVKDYNQARKDGMRDKHTQEHLGAQPEFFDSGSQGKSAAGQVLNSGEQGSDSGQANAGRAVAEDVVAQEVEPLPRESRLPELSKNPEEDSEEHTVREVGDVTVIEWKDGSTREENHNSRVGPFAHEYDRDGQLTRFEARNGHEYEIKRDKEGNVSSFHSEAEGLTYATRDGENWTATDADGKTTELKHNPDIRTRQKGQASSAEVEYINEQGDLVRIESSGDVEVSSLPGIKAGADTGNPYGEGGRQHRPGGQY